MRFGAVLLFLLFFTVTARAETAIYGCQVGDQYNYYLDKYLNPHGAGMGFTSITQGTIVIPEGSYFSVSPANLTIDGSLALASILISVSYSGKSIEVQNPAYGGGFFIFQQYRNLFFVIPSEPQNISADDGSWLYFNQMLINTTKEIGYTQVLIHNMINQTLYSYMEFRYDKQFGALNFENSTTQITSSENVNETTSLVLQLISVSRRNTRFTIPWTWEPIILGLITYIELRRFVVDIYSRFDFS